MAANQRSAKDAKSAADLIKRGYPHGRRPNKPYPNSGGLTMVMKPGSSKFQRLQGKKKS